MGPASFRCPSVVRGALSGSHMVINGAARPGIMPLRFEQRGPIALLTLDRPEVHNAIDPETHRSLVAAWERVRDDEGIRAAVLTGAGEKAFSVGVDLRAIEELYAEVPPDRRREVWNRRPGIGGLTRNFDVGKPVIAAIRGYCLGGGLELALACDLRICTPDATFGLPELKWAIIPGQGGTQRLPRSVPPNIALEMILTGEPISAARAFEVGLVNRVVASDRLLDEAIALAEKIAARSPRAVRAAREAVLRGLDLALGEGLRVEQDLADPLRGSEENRAAVREFGRKKASR